MYIYNIYIYNICTYLYILTYLYIILSSMLLIRYYHIGRFGVTLGNKIRQVEAQESGFETSKGSIVKRSTKERNRYVSHID